MMVFLKALFIRILAKPYYVGLSIFLTLSFVVVAFVISNTAETNISVAYLSDEASVSLDAPFMRVKKVDETPSQASLMMGEYDVFVLVEDGEYMVQSMTSDTYVSLVEAYLAGDEVSEFMSSPRPSALRIVGFLMIILFLQCIFYLDLFIEDKLSGNLSRMMMSNQTLSRYLFSVMLYGFIIIIGIAMLVIVMASTVFNQAIGLNLGQYMLVFALSVASGMALALLLLSLIKVRDNAAALFSLIVILTSILSGAFTPVDTNQAVLNAIIEWLPQRQLMALSEALYLGETIWTHIVYVLVFVGVFLMIAFSVIKRHLQLGRY